MCENAEKCNAGIVVRFLTVIGPAMLDDCGRVVYQKTQVISNDHPQAMAGQTGPTVLIAMVLPKAAQNYTKPELESLISRLKHGDRDAEYECVNFFLAESLGIWHGRARAKICRNLKNHHPDATLRLKLVEKIISRLKTGNFSEQFKDQLTMAIRFSPDKMLETAHRLRDSEKEYVRRYAAWVCNAIDNAR